MPGPLKFSSGKVEFDNVDFSYDGKAWILRGLSFTIRGGETVAFVGATGAGKSTVLKLIARFLRHEQGCHFD